MYLHDVCLVFVFLMLLRLFIAALWSHCWERADLLAPAGYIYLFFYFPVWYSESGVVLDCIVS